MPENLTAKMAEDLAKMAAHLFEVRRQIAELQLHSDNLNDMIMKLVLNCSLPPHFMIYHEARNTTFDLQFNSDKQVWIVAVAMPKADNPAPFKFVKDRG